MILVVPEGVRSGVGILVPEVVRGGVGIPVPDRGCLNNPLTVVESTPSSTPWAVSILESKIVVVSAFASTTVAESVLASTLLVECILVSESAAVRVASVTGSHGAERNVASVTSGRGVTAPDPEAGFSRHTSQCDRPPFRPLGLADLDVGWLTRLLVFGRLCRSLQFGKTFAAGREV